MTSRALLPGTCAGCREPITPGDLVVDVDGDLVHVVCRGGPARPLTLRLQEAS